MSPSERLRRLDALFAERVMGLRDSGCDCPFADDGHDTKTGRCNRCNRFRAARYTRSLDAAWEGIHVLRRGDTKNAAHITFATPGNEHQWGNENNVALTRNGWDVGEGFDIDGPILGRDDCSHPAEALVLACLRAVGCTEEELG